MVKKSKNFENLNSFKSNNTENIILKEFVKNINSHISYIQDNFPDFWNNHYHEHFSEEITIFNLNSKQSKSTIEMLKVLFEEYEITNEKLDDYFVNKFKYNNFLCFYEKNFYKFNKEKINLKNTGDLLNYCIRAERTYKKYLDYLVPDGFTYFEKIKREVKSIVLDQNYLNLGKSNINVNDLLLRKKDFLAKKGVESLNIYLFYNEFDSFCKKYIHAKGLKSIHENIKTINQGATFESKIQMTQNFFYKSFLTYLAMEQLLIVASRFGRELFGTPKNHLAEEGSSIVRYKSYFVDIRLANDIRNISILQNMQYQDFFSFKDSHNKELFSSFMSGDSHSLLIPLIILRYFFVNGEAFVVNLPNHNNFIVSLDEEIILFKMNSVILNWCSKRFKKCMKFYK